MRSLPPALLALPGWAAPVQQPHSQAELIAERTGVAPGRALTVALRLQMEEGWHVYWKNPGDSGMATSIDWALPAGLSAGAIQWPYPARIDTGPLTSYGYDHEVLLLVELQPSAALAPGASVPIRAKADWLVCKEICLPASADLALELPVAMTAATDPRWRAAFTEAHARLPVKARDWRVDAVQRGGELTLHLAAPAGAPALDDLAFFPERGRCQRRPQRFERTAAGYALHLWARCNLRWRAHGCRCAGRAIAWVRARGFDVPSRSPRLRAPGTPVARARARLRGGVLLN
jgi:DsbC/DsbD-like thiol-disulfide interchange protein